MIALVGSEDRSLASDGEAYQETGYHTRNASFRALLARKRSSRCNRTLDDNCCVVHNERKRKRRVHAWIQAETIGLVITHPRCA